VVGTFLNEIATPAGLALTTIGVVALTILVKTALSSTKIEKERMYVVLVLMFFSMLFWAFFEQAGSSVSNFTDRNVNRVVADRVVMDTDVGEVLTFEPNMSQFGYSWQGDVIINGAAEPWHGGAFLLDDLDGLRARARGDQSEASGMMGVLQKSYLLGGMFGGGEEAATSLQVRWTVEPAHVGMQLEGSEVPASTFQAANPIFILLFAPLFTFIWTITGRKGFEPSTPVKFGLGLVQLGMGFGALWYGAANADELGIVSVVWLLLGYMLHTTGELCLSPVGLSMVTKLSPARIVSTVMGAWFLATAFSAYLAGIIATFTGVSEGAGEAAGIPAPIETVHVYGGVFGSIAIAALASAAIVLAMSPLLKKWMHEGVEDDPEKAPSPAP
jgi:proton-dependent oligopeptide transporter, POT family